MFLFRKGASFLIIASHNIHETVNVLTETFNPIRSVAYCDHFKDKFEWLSGFAGPTMCVLLFAEELHPLLTFENLDFKHLMLVDVELSTLLIDLLNIKESAQITSVRVSPQLIMAKTVGEPDKYIQRVIDDLEGEIGLPQDLYERYASGTILMFTQDILKRSVPFNRLHDKALFCPLPVYEVMSKLSLNRLKYINASIGHHKWHECTIKIYDIYEQYDLHYRRVRLILDHSDLGFVIHEGWGRDTVRPMMSVGVYTLTFITFQDPTEIKRLLQVLEFNAQNERIADIDCYLGKKKIAWHSLRTTKNQTKQELAASNRALCLSLLDDDELLTFISLETAITKGQKK
ncbi:MULTISPECIES: hypothetical protein [unclassified Fusibacter]|uniref:hypothetical protein n=1 Tax=unclassified Fusibacter TaxID=2624464 RepID=UPI0010105B63|nr:MULTISPECIES: hypothetical protein [unclassified Fusibacter]MCK8061451.1 hypothetical protein [Fusibacter sp. A2]NPE23638.1 hypothetical protein [Fusibacter sp. A1]RXV58911.1 hypothetical protein DWB64_17770 [Fusibacter sp. A1]